MDKLNSLKTVMTEVYGIYRQQGWKPKPYTDTKGRYLWTDAYGVCNFITLFHETGEQQYLDQADALIQDVHNVLGRDRSGTRRLGNATDTDPTQGGLRIGKIDPEGTSDGDGQYFHYLTKWMFALNRMSHARDNLLYNTWAVQLAKSVHPHFVHFKAGSEEPHMYWKISVDMSRPHVLSEGNLDPYDGYITYRLLQERHSDKTVLEKEIADMYKMVYNKYKKYKSNDPLDLGEALWITHWYPGEEWANHLTNRSLEGINWLYTYGEFDRPRNQRLAFREFGTTIGVQCNPRAGSEWVARANALMDFWSNSLYTRDQDITPVMYCASLIPGVLKNDYRRGGEL